MIGEKEMLYYHPLISSINYSPTFRCCALFFIEEIISRKNSFFWLKGRKKENKQNFLKHYLEKKMTLENFLNISSATSLVSSLNNNQTLWLDGDCDPTKANCHGYIRKMISFYKTVSLTGKIFSVTI